MTVTSRMVPPSFATVSINRAYVNVDSIGSARKILARMLGGLYTQSVDGNCSSRVASVQLSKDSLSSSDTSPATRSNAIAPGVCAGCPRTPDDLVSARRATGAPTQLPAKSHCSQNHRAGSSGGGPFVCEVLRIAHTRPTIARKSRTPPATGPQFGAAINRSHCDERRTPARTSNHGRHEAPRLHGGIDHARPRALTIKSTAALQ